MMIRPIDDGHGHRRPAKRVGREEACEAAADNYDSVWSVSRHKIHLASFVVSHATPAALPEAWHPYVPQAEALTGCRTIAPAPIRICRNLRRWLARACPCRCSAP